MQKSGSIRETKATKLDLRSSLTKKLQYDESGNPFCEIPLTKNLHAKISPEDFELVSAFKWCASRESRNTKWYAIRRERGVKIRMHRLVMGLPTGKLDERVVDHLNHDGLDNRRTNLEVITQEENMLRSVGWKKKFVEPCL